MFLLRPAHLNDLDALLGLARELDSLNLPADRRELAAELENSGRSILRNSKESRFMFVAEVDGRVVGTSSIFAKHGVAGFPHIYFQITEVEKHSSLLGSRLLRFLSLETDEDGPTELGGLVVSPAWRLHPLKLGLQLSMMRFLFIASRPEYFETRLLSEMMPTLRPDRTSPLWDAVGHKFTNLTYAQADRLSIHNKEFILSLYPREPICMELLPEEAQAVIGVTGEASKPAERMLLRTGLKFLRQVCPFDGGPHLGAASADTVAVRQSRRVLFQGVTTADFEEQGMVMVGSGESLRCTLAQLKFTEDGQGIWLDAVGQNLLKVDCGQRVWALPLRGVSVRAEAQAATV